MIQALAKFSQQITAGETWMQRVYGRQFLILTASAAVDVKFLDISGQLLGSATGMTAGQLGRFPNVIGEIHITSATTQTVTFYVSDENFELGGSSSAIETVEKAAPTLAQAVAVAVGAGLCVQILAGNTDRKEAVVFNPASHTGFVYLRSNNTQAVSALALGPGERYHLDYSGAIFAYNGEAGSVTLQISEFQR